MEAICRVCKKPLPRSNGGVQIYHKECRRFRHNKKSLTPPKE